MNELVRVSTKEVNNAIPITDSLIVSENFKKIHYIVLRDIRNLEKELKESLSKEEFNNYKFVEIERIDSKGRTQTYYEMNRDFFLMLVMGYRTKEAYKIKHKFIQSFNFIEKEINARLKIRHIGVEVRKELSEVIKNYVTDEGNFKNYAYSNYTRLIYKKVFGKDIKKVKKELNIKESDNIRDYLTIDQLKLVQKLESNIANYIEFTDNTNKTDKEIYSEIKIIVEKNL